MKILKLVPDGWKCTLAECPPGLFVSDLDTVCLKTDYHDDKGRTQAYLDNGDFFAGSGKVEREYEVVQPVKAVWEEVE